MSGWKRGSYPITTLDGCVDNDPLRGWRRGPWAITERLRETFSGINMIVHSLTHLPTGWRIGIFNSADIAVECADALDALGDWSALPTPDAVKSAPFYADAAKIVATLLSDRAASSSRSADTAGPVAAADRGGAGLSREEG